ncbi:hypothetical protein LCGC14_2978980 [marine sediment metagenome]|uniref:Uncharacterized protein n=1 Tax=marine sediment metagenome TaxID=412755 RepID=A0A0F8ZER2_9ZZZZ
METETIEFEGCHAWILRNNGKIAIGIEGTKPVGLILLAGLISILGQPEGFTNDDTDDFVVFTFDDKSLPNEITAEWHKVFDK